MTNLADPNFITTTPAFRVVNPANLPIYALDDVRLPSMDQFGRFITTLQLASGGTLEITIGDNLTTTTGIPVVSWTMLFDGTNEDRARSLVDNADAQAVGTIGLQGVINRNQRYNGTSWDRETNNVNLTLLTSGARTATTNSTDQINFNCRGGFFILNVSAGAGFDIQFSVTAKDAISSNYVTFALSNSITATGTYLFQIYPGIVASPGLMFNTTIPRLFRATMVHNNANSVTYSLSAGLIV